MATNYGIKAGKAFVLIEAVDATAKVLDSVRNRIAKFGSDISGLGQTIAFRAAAAMLPVAMSTKTYANFDDALRVVESRSKGTAEEMENLRNQAKELGRTTAFTSTHIGNLMARLAQFGKTRAEIGQMTEPIMLLARAGADPMGSMETDILHATDAVTQMLAAFRLGTEDTSRVVDILATTVNNSRFSLEELGVALQYAAPSAKDFGVSIEDMLSALVGIRELGYEASITGTAFRNMLNYVSSAKERDDFNEALKEMTGNTIKFTDATGNLVNPLEMLIAIRKAVSSLGNVQQADMITKLFEMRATGPARGLGAATETIARMRTAFKDANGAAQKTHDLMETGLGGAFRVLESAVEAVAISIGEALSPALITVSNYLQTVLQNVSLWIQANKGWITATVTTIAALGALGVSLIVLGQSLRMLSGLLMVVSLPLRAITLLFSPGGLLIAGAAALIYLLPGVGTAAQNMAADFIGAITTLGSSFSDTMKSIGDALNNGDVEGAFQLLSSQIELTWKTMLDKLMTAWEAFRSGFKAADPLTDRQIAMQEDSLKRLSTIAESVTDPGMKSLYIANISKQRQELEALKATREGILADLAEPHARRQEELNQIQEAIRAQKEIIAANKAAAEAGGPPFAEMPKLDVADELKKATEEANKLINAGQAAAPYSGAPHANMGLERGSVEAAKAFQENRFNVMNNTLKQLLTTSMSAEEHLRSLDEKIERTEAATTRLVGV
jgi:TP901 family phage tail tape measure protein